MGTPEQPTTTAMELYRIAVEEYRFQVNLNWNRVQYLLVFNVAVIAAGGALIRLDRRALEILAGSVFLFGVVAAIASIAIIARQHGYYRNARDHMRDLEKRYGLPSLTTTEKMGGTAQRGPKVQLMLRAMVGAIGLLDLALALYLFFIAP